MVRNQQKTTAKEPPVVLIGGTGDVGARLAEMLIAQTNLEVIVASRGGGTPKNRQVSLKCIKLDVKSEEAIKAIPQKATVVNLTEATPATFVEQLMRQSCLFLDCSATPEYVDSLESVLTRGGNGKGMICVGTAPGISTLMAKSVAQQSGVSSVHIGVQLGMGRHFGKAATTWFYEALGKPFEASPNSFIKPGRVNRLFNFGKPPKTTHAIGIGFPKQGILSKQEQYKAVQTYLSIDPPYVTQLLKLLLRLGFGTVMQKYAKTLTKITMLLPSLGANGTNLTAIGLNEQNQVVGELSFAGGDQAEITAAVLLCTLLKARNSESDSGPLTTIADHLSLSETLSEINKSLPNMKVSCW